MKTRYQYTNKVPATGINFISTYVFMMQYARKCRNYYHYLPRKNITAKIINILKMICMIYNQK